MGTSNTIPSAPSGVLPTTQPASAGLWVDGGMLTYWTGTVNTIIDINDGIVFDAFGVDTGIDV